MAENNTETIYTNPDANCCCEIVKCCFKCVGPTGPTARCNKSSIYIFKW